MPVALAVVGQVWMVKFEWTTTVSITRVWSSLQWPKPSSVVITGDLFLRRPADDNVEFWIRRFLKYFGGERWTQTFSKFNHRFEIYALNGTWERA
jgi:hypothetical protein